MTRQGMGTGTIVNFLVATFALGLILYVGFVFIGLFFPDDLDARDRIMQISNVLESTSFTEHLFLIREGERFMIYEDNDFPDCFQQGLSACGGGETCVCFADSDDTVECAVVSEQITQFRSDECGEGLPCCVERAGQYMVSKQDGTVEIEVVSR